MSWNKEIIRMWQYIFNISWYILSFYSFYTEKINQVEWKKKKKKRIGEKASSWTQD